MRICVLLRLPRLAAWCLGLALAAGAAAQDFPTRPIRVVMGGGADQLARIVADAMAARYGQAVFVEQKAGATGAMATDFMAKAAPDGYTWMMTTVSFTGQRILQKRPGQDELEPVTMLATFPFVLVVTNELPAKTLPELVALARAQPGKLNFASSGAGAPGHLAGEMLKQMAGIDMVHVPYKSVAQGLTDVMAGQVQLMFVPAPAVVPQVRAGRVRALAVSTARRFKALPEVPTVQEQGWPDYLYVSWNGIHAPPGTPPALLDRLAADIAATLGTPAVRARAEAAGLEPVTMDRQEFADYMRADLARIARVVRDGNIKAE